MKVFVIFLLAAAVFAAPQLDTRDDEDDVEVIAGPRSPPDPEGVLFYFPGFSHMRNIFSNIFRDQPRFPGVGSDDEIFETFPDDSAPRSNGFFSNVFRFFDFPRPSDNSTVTFSNSSVDVVNIGGTSMLVNRTFEERTGDDGSVYFKVEQRLLGPYNDTNSTSESTTASSFSTSSISNTTSTSTTTTVSPA